MKVALQPALEALATLDEADWLGLDGAPPALLRQDFGILRAVAEAIEQPLYIATAREGSGLAGAAIALIESHARGRRVLAVTFPGALHEACCRGIWVARGVDRATVLSALLEAILDGSKALALTRIAIEQCPATERDVTLVADALGFRAFPAPSDYHLHAGAGFAAYLASLDAHQRKCWKRDLRRAPEVGATIELISPIPTALWDELWPLQLDTFARKGAHLRFRPEGLFRALARHVPPSESVATVCRIGDRLIGFLLSHRAEGCVRWPYVGHVADPPLQAYCALMAEMIKSELDRGMSRVLLGYTNDQFKRRICTKAEPQVTLCSGGNVVPGPFDVEIMPATDARAFDEKAWSELVGDTPEVLRQDRAILRAYAETIEDPVYVALARLGDGIVGLAMAIAIVRSTPRPLRMLSILAPGALARSGGTGTWLARGVDGESVARALLEALLAHARSLGLDRVVVQQCPAGDAALRQAAEALGFGALAAPSGNVIEVQERTTFAAHLASLGAHDRQALNRDLRRGAKAGATVEIVSPLTLAHWDAFWPLLLDTFTRKGSLLRLRPEGLFRALARNLRPEDSAAVICRASDRLLGFAAYHRAGAITRCPYVGHVADPPLHVYSALLADFLRAELDRGASTILLGGTTDRSKRRLGAIGVPMVTLYRAAEA